MPVQSVTVGSVEIARVSDGSMFGPPSFFFSGIPPEMYGPALGDELLANGTIEVEFGSFLVRSSGKTVLVDTGMGSKHGLTGGLLLDNLMSIDVPPEDVDVVFNTHLHLDHVGWNCVEHDGEHVTTFPNAEYWIVDDEWNFWTEDERLLSEEGPHLKSDVLPLRNSPQLKLVGSEAAMTPEVSLLPTPGHTPGHSSLAVSSGGEHAIILGDVGHHPLHLERLWIAAVDELPRTSRRTKRALTERMVTEQLLVAAGHFKSGGFGRLVMEDGWREWKTL